MRISDWSSYVCSSDLQPSKIKGPDHRLSDPATEIDARTLEDSPGVFGRRLGVDTGNVRSLFFDWRSPSGPNAHARAIQGVVRDARLIKSCRQPPFGCHRIDVDRKSTRLNSSH